MWDVRPCRLIQIHKRLGEAYCRRFGHILFWRCEGSDSSYLCYMSTKFHGVTFKKNLILKSFLFSNKKCGMWSIIENIPFSYCKDLFLFLGWWRVNSTARRAHVATVHYKSNWSCGESWFMLPLNWKPALYLWNDCRFISSTCLIYCNMT